jgi:hypothetical protein
MSPSFLEWFYDSAHGICCKNFFCRPFSKPQATIVVAENISISIAMKDWPFKLIATCALLFLSLILTWLAWKKIELKVEVNGKKTQLRSRRTFWMYLQYPKVIPTFVISSWFFFFYLTGDQIMTYLWPSPTSIGISDYLALSVAATAVLFPLVILIMDGSKDDRPGVFSSSEVLLRYAYAFPISVMLLSILGISAFRMNYYWMRLTVVFAVVLAAVALLRLLNIIFVPKAWRTTEEKLLKTQARDAIAEIAVQRAGMIATINALKPLDAHVTSYFSTLGKGDFEERQILAKRVGRVTEIRISVIDDAAKALEPNAETASSSGAQAADPRETMPKASSNFQIVIRANEKEIIDKPDEVIATLYFRSSTFSDEQINRTIKRIYSAFHIDLLAETDLSSEQLDLLLSRIRQLGMDAIDSDNEVLATRVAEAYENLIQAILDAFEGLGIKYSLEEAKQETPFYGKDWKPLTRMFRNIGDWIERLSKVNDPSYALRSTITYTPYRLAVSAFTKRDVFTFANSLKLTVRQQHHEKNASIPAFEWLKSLADYQVGGILEAKASDENEQKIILEYVRSLFEVYLYLLKNTIDRGDEASFQQGLNLLNEHPKIFQYEHLDSEIQMQETYLRFATPTQKDAAEKTLKNLKTKHELLQKLKTWRNEMRVGLAAYCLLQLDKLGDPHRKTSDDFLKERFRIFLSDLPDSFLEVVKLRINMNHFDSSERWGWSWWEHMEAGHAKFMSFNSYLDRVFGHLFLKVAANGCNDIDWQTLSLYDRDVMDFRDDPNSVKGILPGLNDQAESLGLEKRSPQELLAIDTCFDKIRSTARLNSDLRIARSPVSEIVIETFKSTFEESFLKRNRLRNVFTTRIGLPVRKDQDQKWGINLLFQREFFVENPEISSPDFGSQYGGDLGASEDAWVLKELAEKSEVVQSTTASQLISLSIEKGLNADSLILLTARDAFSMRALRADPGYKYDHQVRDSKLKGLANGFIETKGLLVPVFSFHYQGKFPETLPNLIALNPSDVELHFHAETSAQGYLPKTGFTFSLVDPLDSSRDGVRLKQDLLSRNPDWLKAVDQAHKDELVGKRIWIRLLEDIEIKVKRKPLGIRSLIDD